MRQKKTNKELKQLKKFVLERKRRIEIPRNFRLISNPRRRLKPVSAKQKRPIPKRLDSESDDEVIMAEHDTLISTSEKRKREDDEDITGSKSKRLDMDQLADNFILSMVFSDANPSSRTSRAPPPSAPCSPTQPHPPPASSSTFASDLSAPSLESETHNRKQPTQL